MNRNLIIIAVFIVITLGVFQYYKQQQNSEHQNYLHIARLTDGLDAMLLLENTMRYYYEDHGEMPSSNEQVKLGDPKDYANRSLRSASILSGGIIELVFKANTGVDGGVLRLTPKYTPKVEARMIAWSCETSDYPKIINFECQYTGHNTKD